MDWRMHCPTRKPRALVLPPWKSATTFWLASMTDWTMASRALVSLIWARPFSRSEERRVGKECAI